MMTSKAIYSLIVLCISLHYVQPTEINAEYDFDVFIFTQNWPATICKEWLEKDKKHQCTLPLNRYAFTVHGLWPTKFGTIGPAFCNRTWHFDPEQVKPIETTLMQYWLNIEAGTATYSLWAHEWNKHGTCAAQLESLNSEYKYFSTGIDLIQKYMMSNILKEFNIVPSDTAEYSVLDISNAIKSKLGVDPVIECREIKGGRNLLSDIRICFDKNLQLTNCDGVVFVTRTFVNGASVLTNCNRNQGVVFPYHVPEVRLKQNLNTYWVEWYKLITWIHWLTL